MLLDAGFPESELGGVVQEGFGGADANIARLAEVTDVFLTDRSDDQI